MANVIKYFNQPLMYIQGVSHCNAVTARGEMCGSKSKASSGELQFCGRHWNAYNPRTTVTKRVPRPVY